MARKIRVILSKVGLDGHDRGVVTVGMALKDAGMEVIYLGRQQFPEQIANAAAQEDPDVIGISSLADAHMVLVPRLLKILKEKKVDIPVIVGGFIQPEDVDKLKQLGVAEIFGIGSQLDDIVDWIKNHVAAQAVA